MTPTFTADHSDVFWGPVRLSPQSIEDLLDVLHREGCAAAYNELYEAELKAGGVPRCSSFRVSIPMTNSIEEERAG